MAVSVAVGYFWMARKRSSPCFPLSPGWTGGSWRTFIRLRFSPPRRNVSDECVFGFQGSRKAHRLLTFSLPNFFARFPHFFKKIFCAGSRKQKSAHCTCLVGVVSAKNKTRSFLTESHIWIYSFQKTAPQNHFCEAEIQSHIFLGIRGAPLV